MESETQISKSPTTAVLILGPEPQALRLKSALAGLGIDGILGGGDPPAFRGSAPRGSDSLRALREMFSRFREAERGRRHLWVHPGTGEWGNRPEFVWLAQEEGLIPISPSARLVSLFSNKVALLSEADRLGIPHAVLSFDPVQSLGELARELDRGKWPLPMVLKSTRSGAGFGVFVLREREDLERRVPLWLEQLRHHGSEAQLFFERCLMSARHVVLPFMRIGNDIQWFPTIDASLQLRFRKLLSFTLDDQALDPKARNRMFESGEKLLREVRYQGVGALEFLVEGDEAYFVEGISRLGMDFELWEHASETSMVEHQLLALGLICESPKRSRASSTPLFALHARFYAEDPLLGLPSPGQFDQVELPKIEEQTGFTLRLPLRTQTAISWEDSGFLGTLTLSGRDRKATMDHAIQVLRDLWLPGSVVTTQDFLVDLLEHPLVREDFIAAGFLEDTFIPRTLPDTKMMVQAASALGEIAESSRIRVGGVVIQADPRKVEWGELGPWSVLPQVEGRLPAWEGVLRDGTRLYAARVTEGRWMLRVGTWMGWARTRSEVPERGGSGVRSRPLLSQVAGKIHAILFLERARVQAREVMVLIECMGVLVPHAIPKPCRIERWEVSAEEVVKLGTCLATFELEG